MNCKQISKIPADYGWSFEINEQCAVDGALQGWSRGSL